MFKRANKLTSLLVAAAAIISVVPVTATSAEAVTRLEIKDGSFSSAVAYDGKYLYDGYKEEKDSAVYVSDNSSDEEVDKYDDYSGYKDKYGSKYVLASESNEDYLVDLSKGKIDTSSSVQDKKEDTKNNLKRKLKLTDRYGKNVSVANNDLTLIKQNTFGDIWYKYTAVPGSDAEDHNDVTVDGDLFGFVNEDGNYMDASSKANLVVLSGGKTVKIDEFGKEKDGVKVSLKSIDAIAQDKDNIYAIIEVNVSGGNTAGAETKQTFIQKISKSISGDKDGAKLPKNVDSYMLTSVFDGSDDDKAANLISASSSDYYTVKGGTLYLAQKTSSTKVKVTKFNLKKEKTSLASDTSTKLDVYTIKVDDDEDHDITSGSNISIDVDGNIWGVNKGKIFKFDGLNATDVYTCDTAVKNLDVYNEKNLVVWADNIYSAVVNGSGVTNSGNNNADNNNNNNSGNTGNTGNANGTTNNGNNNGIGSNLNNGASTLVPSGWVKQGNNWYFKYSDGSNKTGWYYELGNWYYFYGNGQMATAFINLGGGAFYYLNPNSDGNQGAMKKGWQKIDGYWYYFNPVSDSYGYEGMMAIGWRNIGGVWYYFYSDGKMAANTRIEGYYVNGSGAWVPGK